GSRVTVSVWRLVLEKAAWIIFAAALLSRVVLVLALRPTAETFYDEPGQVAISLSDRGQFADPYATPTGPTAHVAPLMPVILALFIRIFGNVETAWLASRLLECVVIALFAALLPSLAERFGLSRRAGIVAGAVAALPTFLWIETNGKFETTYILLATTLLVAFTAYRLTHNRLFGTTRSWALTGLAWGLGVLITPTLLPVLFALVAYGMVLRGENARLKPRQAAAALGTAALVFVPYSVQRSLALRAPVLVRSNFGLELFLSNNDRAQARFLENMAPGGVMRQHHPLSRRRESIRVRSMGEGAYNALLQRRAIAWIIAHPARFTRLTLTRVKEFWFPTANSALKTAFLWGVAIAGIGWLASLALGRDAERSTLARLWLVALFAFSLIQYVIQADVRYRYPLQGLLLLATSAGAVELFQRRGRPSEPIAVRRPSSEQRIRRAPHPPVERPEGVPVHAEGQPVDAAAPDVAERMPHSDTQPSA
ncbi:MAG TPA: glycosyltransferase family 39 protein, partial [Gemmatimonadaceae bacterium]|nr:glycosyltransferase family 39 protein [Gemmatimonadaceae bacterium]